MGTIASVLQWHCEGCGKINATERAVCFECGTSRPARLKHSSSQQSTKSGKKESNSNGLARSVSQNQESFAALRDNVTQRKQQHTRLKHSISYSSSPGRCVLFAYPSYLIIPQKIWFTKLLHVVTFWQENGIVHNVHFWILPVLKNVSLAQSQKNQLVTLYLCRITAQLGLVSAAHLWMLWILTVVRFVKLLAVQTFQQHCLANPLL